MMSTYESLNREIRQLTEEIGRKHPELMKYMEELPLSVPSGGERKEDREILEEYRDSLRAILLGYTDKNKKKSKTK